MATNTRVRTHFNMQSHYLIDMKIYVELLKQLRSWVERGEEMIMTFRHERKKKKWKQKKKK